VTGGETCDFAVLKSTWKTQRDALLVSWLHCSASIIVYEHWIYPFLLRKTSSDSSLQHSGVCVHRKVRGVPGDGGDSLQGTGRLAALTFYRFHICATCSTTFNYPVKLYLYPL